MENTGKRCPGCRRESCAGCGIFQKLNTNKQLRVQFPEGFRIEPGEGLGVAFDVGTTTLAGMLWDLAEGRLLDAETAANPQAAFGADVISRIQGANESEEKLRQMQRLLVEKLEELVCRMLHRSLPEDNGKEGGGGKVKKAVAVGNTAMCEILLGIMPRGLSKAPFVPDYREGIRLKGERLGFRLLQDAEIIVPPPIGGYVGADALAVYCYVNCMREKTPVLTVDIGTNGEILLQKGKEKYACSVAAGPALEGGAVSCGMRAAKGAIDMVSLTGRFPMTDIGCRVIGKEKPAGICGSGLVDALAVLYQCGVLDSTGYMRSEKEAREAGTPEKLCRRIETEGKERKFLLTDKTSPVYLRQEDVRHLQLAVGAIGAGIEILLKKADMGLEELGRIYLAGAFGCYLNIESSIAIGLFPDAQEKLWQAGNLAGTGASMVLLSDRALQELEKESGEFAHIELAGEKEFEEQFLGHMNFPLQK